jgi:nitrogen fixation NifU-like protein
MHEENISVYPENILNLAQNLKHFGRMTDPTSGASIRGPCGEEMEFYLVVKNGIIEDVKFYTTGCIATKVCGSMTAQMVFGKSIKEALSISPQKVIESLEGLPQDNCHCSILAVSTLYRAIADYLLKR